MSYILHGAMDVRLFLPLAANWFSCLGLDPHALLELPPINGKLAGSKHVLGSRVYNLCSVGKELAT